ncbi:tRNA 2-thiouridine(34) synthase MnmA [Aquisalimonas sp.]|uniref:tRNA 2-thiouridine(34) synthase MnmA n=1 Tax=Aquisalimonas sp. TaxID=1872621 RepID=UPI0025C30E42|nr:tRNA 2-thiouridine(34) synthase MnmA [Aquisalimonas sp.]
MSTSRAPSVIVGLSGGVDSSVAALRLVEQGYRVQGLFMRNWEDDDTDTVCTAEQDLADVRQVCAELDIALHQVNFAARYRQQVFDDCLREFEAGRTPNPDVLCNREIKFRAFLDHATRLGADYVATGHYARLGEADGQTLLLRGRDRAKDQSYFLYMVGHEALARTLFPVGDVEKAEVRRIAEDAGFDNFEKKDSTGICFIGERDFRGFLSRYIAGNPGPIVDTTGQRIGEHQGLSFYTLGQRQGLGIGGRASSGSQPWYVVDKDMDTNTLIVAQGVDHPALFCEELEATDVHWVAGRPPVTHGVYPCTAKVRYRQPDQSCKLAFHGSGVRVRFNEPQRAVTPGQSVVFYQGERCLGGGIIARGYQAGDR